MKPNYQRIIIEGIVSAAPNLKYTAIYSKTDSLKECMQDYNRRSFVYALSVEFQDKDTIIYVGKTATQYTRMISHNKKYEYDKVYLFECNPGELNKSEKAVIEKFAPLYNKNDNPLASRYSSLLNIDYISEQKKETILKNLELLKKYNNMGLYGFELPKIIYNTILRIAIKKDCSVSEIVQTVLEKSFEKDIHSVLHGSNNFHKDTNLITSQEYGKKHNAKSQEQIKQYLQKNRISGATKVGRDWVLLEDTPYPDDHRSKTRKHI